LDRSKKLATSVVLSLCIMFTSCVCVPAVTYADMPRPAAVLVASSAADIPAASSRDAAQNVPRSGQRESESFFDRVFEKIALAVMIYAFLQALKALIEEFNGESVPEKTNETRPAPNQAPRNIPSQDV